MSKPSLWITRCLSGATLERAARDDDVVLNHDDHPGTAEQLIAASAEFDAIIPCHSEHFSAEVVAQFSDRLKIGANHSVGVDHCDLPALKARGITVTNTPDVLWDATAELAMLPHIGSATRQTRDAIGYRALDNLDAYFAGRTPGDLLQQPKHSTPSRSYPACAASWAREQLRRHHIDLQLETSDGLAALLRDPTCHTPPRSP